MGGAWLTKRALKHALQRSHLEDVTKAELVGEDEKAAADQGDEARSGRRGGPSSRRAAGVYATRRRETSCFTPAQVEPFEA